MRPKMRRRRARNVSVAVNRGTNVRSRSMEASGLVLASQAKPVQFDAP